MRCNVDSQREKIANLLERFVRGDILEWEFDDFLCSRSEDLLIDGFRTEISQLPLRYPPVTEGHYTSSEGMHRIIEIARVLRGPVQDKGIRGSN
jgi:hypothetical protein